jgi:hypothetical protein
MWQTCSPKISKDTAILGRWHSHFRLCLLVSWNHMTGETIASGLRRVSKPLRESFAPLMKEG